MAGRSRRNRRAFSKVAYLRTRSFQKAIEIESPRLALGALPCPAGFRLPADLDTASRSAAAAGTSAATVRDQLDPEGTIALVVRGAGGAAQRLQAGLRRAGGCAGVSR